MRRMGVALGLGGGALAAALLTPPAIESVRALWLVRDARATLAAQAAAPVKISKLVVAPGLAIRARDGDSAARLLAADVRAGAARAGVLVEALVPAAPRPGIVTLKMRLSGSEKAVIAMIDAVERGTPLARFRDWRMSALAGGGVRVEGELVAAWH